MRVLVVGAGAIGGYFGSRLLDGGRDVTFLVRPRRAALLKKNGLVVKTPDGETRRDNPPTVLAADLKPGYDLILLSCKAFDLEGAMNDFAPAVGPDTAILPMLNGMRHLDVLDQRFGKEKVLGGLCAIAATLDAEGAIHQLTPMQNFRYGEREGSRSARIDAIEELIADNFNAAASDDIIQAMWEKWIMLSSLAGSTSLMRATVGDIVAAPQGREFLLGVMGEVSAIATAAGHAPGEEFVDKVREMLTEEGSPMTASMFRDIRNNARIEADQIIGDLLQYAASFKLADEQTRLLRLIYTHLKAYEAAQARSAASQA